MKCLVTSVADPWRSSRIPDLGSWIQKQQQKRGVKINLLSYLFFVATNFTKLKIILFFKWWRKKFGPIFKDYWRFYQKNCNLSSQKYGVGIRDPEKIYSGSRCQKGTGSRIRNTAGDLYHFRNVLTIEEADWWIVEANWLDEPCGRFPCDKAGDDARERDPGGAHWHDIERLIILG